MDSRNASLMIGYLTILGSVTLILLEVTYVRVERDDIFSPTIKELNIGERKFYLKNYIEINYIILYFSNDSSRQTVVFDLLGQYFGRIGVSCRSKSSKYYYETLIKIP